MEHLRHEMNRWYLTTQKHGQSSKDNHRHSTKQRSPKTHRKLSTPSRTPIRSKRSPSKVLSRRGTTISDEKIFTTGIHHRSSNKTPTVTTPQQLDRPPIPPPDCDPPLSNEHKHHLLLQKYQPYTPDCDSWILRPKTSTLHASILCHIQQKLSNTTGMTEVTKEEPTDRAGAHITLPLKGRTAALYEAQQNLERSVKCDFS